LTNVQFTDLSTGSPTGWIWKKNGVQFSTLQNPTATFSSSGVYSISLTASNSSGSSTSSSNITVYNNPTANFAATSTASGCLPLTVSFQDNSTIVGGTISTRLWSFGDGGQSSAANPNHTYTLSGNFPVSLKVTDNHGCEDTKQIPNYVQVYALPNVSFSSNSVRQNCAPPLSVTFINNSSGTGTLTYLWNFGDGNTSTQANPSHTYTSMGTFNVKLTVTDNNSCSNSETYNAYVKIQSITANFSLSADSICLGDFGEFTNSSTGANSFSWKFGDNTSASGYSVTHTYQDSGWFRVRMIASIAVAGCSDTAYRNIYVQRVVADFTPVPNYICELSQEVIYVNNSVNWDFRKWYRDKVCPNIPPFYMKCGKGDTEDTVLYHDLIPNFERIYSDTLVVRSKLGCIDTMIKDTSVIVSLVRAGPVLSQASGCRPYIISFTGNAVAYNASVMVPNPPVTLTSFEWKIDDTVYSTLQHPPNLNLVDTGLWWGSFKVKNSLGCEDISQFSIRAGDSVKADFYMLKDTVCAAEFDSAITLSTDQKYINNYQWFTIPSASTIFGKNAAFQMNKIGNVNVGHIVDHHGCADTIVKFNAFYAQGPVVSFYPTLFNCTDSTKISFVSLMQQAYRWYWNFGDSLLPVDSTSINPVVTYSKKGNYYATLTAYNQDSSCSYFDGRAIIAGNLKSVIRTDTGTKSLIYGEYYHVDTVHGCAPFEVYFTSYRSPGAMIADWFMDGDSLLAITTDTIISHTFKKRGYYTVTLIVYDTVAYCIDTSQIVVGAYKPIPDFIGNPNVGCTPLNVFLDDTVISYNPIVSYDWLVGPVQKSTQNFNQIFSGTVIYNARLIVADGYGCSDTIIKADYVRSSNFNIDFYATNIRLICAGDSIKFIQALPVNNVAYTWIYGSGDTAYGPTPWLLFPDSGVFNVKLIAIDSSGCKKIQLKSNYVKVQAYPNPDFVAVPTDSNCYPLPVQFYADTNMPYFEDNTYYYDLGDYSAASNYKNPFYNYVRPGSYTVSLKVTTPYGCKETTVKSNYINISGPYAEIDFQPDSVCRGDSVMFQMLNPINAYNFGWDFGDGNSILNKSPVYHIYYDSVGFVQPILFFTDSTGGCAKTFTDTIYIFETIAEFSLIDTIGCIPFDPEIKNLSKKANKYDWVFGDGAISKTKNPVKIYKKPGRYLIELRVRGFGCSDSAFQFIDVFPVPLALAKSDTLICEGDSVQLYSAGGSTYQWSPSVNLSNYQAQNPMAFPVISTGYEVLVTDTNGCQDIDSVQIIVQNPISLDLDDLVLVVGDTLTLLKAYGGTGVTYKWIPSTGLSCDTCARPKLTALESGEYTLIITDTNNCFETATTFYLEVEDKYTLDVPEAFTPNGDGVNDVIYVRGWGIKELITFKIYNRWGELIFESNELSVGWDGTYKGKMQGIETYVFYVEALTYGDNVLKKKGNINLLQ